VSSMRKGIIRFPTQHDTTVLGARLKKARKDKGLYQKEVAAAINKLPKDISLYEAGTHVPSDAPMESLAALYEVDINYFLDAIGWEYKNGKYKRQELPYKLPLQPCVCPECGAKQRHCFNCGAPLPG